MIFCLKRKTILKILMLLVNYQKIINPIFLVELTKITTMLLKASHNYFLVFYKVSSVTISNVIYVKN